MEDSSTKTEGINERRIPSYACRQGHPAAGGFGEEFMESGWIVLSSQDDANSQADVKIIRRRDYHTTLYKTLPYWNSLAFWQVVEQSDFPLEILVKLSRLAFQFQDYACEKRCLTLIFLRLQGGIQNWAVQVMKKYPISIFEERQRLAADLSADLHEAILRAVRDPQRLFWEENFLHCLVYERRHVQRAFLMREGRWHDTRVGKSRRIPSNLITSLDRPMHVEGQSGPMDLEDEYAHLMLLSVEVSDLSLLVARLPLLARRPLDVSMGMNGDFP